MLEVCASKIGDIILSVLESKMENKLDEVKKAKIISDTRKSICEFEEKYLQNHDGTVLTSREFGEYLQYSKPMMHFQLRCIKILRWLHLSPY